MMKLRDLEVKENLVKELVNNSSFDNPTMTFTFPNGSFNINQGRIGLKSCEQLMGMDDLFIEKHDFRPAKEQLANFIFAAVFNGFDALVDKELSSEVFSRNSFIMDDEYGYITNELEQRYDELGCLFPSLNPEFFLPFIRRCNYNKATGIFTFQDYKNGEEFEINFYINEFSTLGAEFIKEPNIQLWCTEPCADELNAFLNFFVYSLLHSVGEALTNEAAPNLRYLDSVYPKAA